MLEQMNQTTTVELIGRKGGSASCDNHRDLESRKAIVGFTAAHYDEDALEVFCRTSPAAAALRVWAEATESDLGD